MAQQQATRKVAVISGYYNVPHAGHMEYVKLSKEFVGPDGILYVIVNNDEQAILKKGFSFVPQDDRVAIMGALKGVDMAVLSIDKDRTVCETIQWLCDNAEHKPNYCLNGGDVDANNPSPEDKVCAKNGITMLYGFGDKIQSSSWILDKSVKSAYDVMFGTKKA